jgi:hypothetical protein
MNKRKMRSQVDRLRFQAHETEACQRMAALEVIAPLPSISSAIQLFREAMARAYR